MIKTINGGPPGEWTPEIEEAWSVVANNDPIVAAKTVRANWFTARPYVDQYNTGSTTEGFVFTERSAGVPRVFIADRTVEKPTEPYLNPRGEWR